LILPIISYLKNTVDENAEIEIWQNPSMFPTILKDLNNFYRLCILDKECILIKPVGELQGINSIQKQIRQISTLSDMPSVLYLNKISDYRRKSLIHNRISFIVEDGQMFLPFLALDLKKAAKKFYNRSNSFSPVAQMAYLFFLYAKDQKANATDLAKLLEISIMDASRALQSLYSLNLLTVETSGKTGRSKIYQRIDDPEYFIQGLNKLRSPIKKRVYLKNDIPGSLIAGLDALSSLSMLNPPQNSVRAIGYLQYRNSQLEKVENLEIVNDMQVIELEVWHYNPLLFSKNIEVDKLSLYCSLKDSNDERIEIALEEVLRGESWYMA